jgi:DNA polymerase elongation subunit (family B)
MIDIEQVDGQLKVSYFNREGNIDIDYLNIPADQLYEWEYVKHGDKSHPNVTSWDNKPVKKKRAKYLSKWRVEEFFMSLPERETERIFEFNMPRKFFIDIEVFVGDEWPRPENAKFPVTCITFCIDSKVMTLGTIPLSQEAIARIKDKAENHLKEKIEYNYIEFKSEYDMMYSFFHKAVQKMPLLTGWNFIGYDWRYLVNRCKKLGIDASVASPSGKLVGDNDMPLHRLVVDYLDIYKKWDRVIDIKENNTLDYVAKAALGIQKVKYSGTLQDLYANNYEDYVFYNVVDTKLVEMIDRKLNTLLTFLKLGSITRVESNRAYSPIWMAESAMAREFYKRGKIFPRTEKQNKKREAYEGALVMDPRPGMYHWVTSFDFASLYPSIMRQWNISPESYVTNTIDEIDTTQFVKTSSGAVFSKKEDSAFKTILTDYYGQRKNAKKVMEGCEEDIEELKKYI